MGWGNDARSRTGSYKYEVGSRRFLPIFLLRIYSYMSRLLGVKRKNGKNSRKSRITEKHPIFVFVCEVYEQSPSLCGSHGTNTGSEGHPSVFENSKPLLSTLNAIQGLFLAKNGPRRAFPGRQNRPPGPKFQKVALGSLFE